MLWGLTYGQEVWEKGGGQRKGSLTPGAMNNGRQAVGAGKHEVGGEGIECRPTCLPHGPCLPAGHPISSLPHPYLSCPTPAPSLPHPSPILPPSFPILPHPPHPPHPALVPFVHCCACDGPRTDPWLLFFLTALQRFLLVDRWPVQLPLSIMIQLNSRLSIAGVSPQTVRSQSDDE